jgi:cytochrome d ubiquinol oxidase subunit II
VFSLSSAALALVFGVALGNVVRGVPLNARGYFSLPLFHILNWYALLVGLTALVVTAAQGASFLAARAGGELGARARVWAQRLVPAQVVALVILIIPTYSVRHNMLNVFGDHAWTVLFPLAVLAAITSAILAQSRGDWLRAFFANSIAVAAVLATLAAGIYPWILPAHQGRPFGLSVHNAAAGHHALTIATVWWPIGIALALGYFSYAYRLLFRSPQA